MQWLEPTGAVRRTIIAGGLSKVQLLERLRAGQVALNPAAQALFDDERFVPAPRPAVVHTLELVVADLGLIDGATMAGIVAAAAAQGLVPCPLELAAHLRLELVDQPEGYVGQPETRHQAPPGALTVVSPALDADDAVPKGFYLRRIDGVLWLRGYRSGPDHHWSPHDRLVFRVQDSNDAGH